MDWVVPGAVLAGKYALEQKLGQGGMGAVWRAQHVQLKSPVAIKLIDEQIAQNPEALQRFMREAQSAAALRSPHVVQILDYGADRGVPYIAMELLEGESLADRLTRVGRLSPAELAAIMTEVARAIGKAHDSGIVHRDLKPDNIFLVRNDEVEVTKVLDFGIAKAQNPLGVASGSETRTGAILGTPHYMSPEQAEGTKLVDNRTDLWALGVIAFECLLGRRPFDSDALGSLLLAICTRPIPVPSAWGLNLPGFDAWFAKACAREPAERFQSARELVNALRQVLGNVPGTELTLPDESRGAFAATAAMLNTPFAAVPPTAGVPSAPTPTPKKSRLGPVVGALVAAAALGGVAILATRRGTTPVSAEPNDTAPVAALVSATAALAPPQTASEPPLPVPPPAPLPSAATAPAPVVAPAPIVSAAPPHPSAEPGAARPRVKPAPHRAEPPSSKPTATSAKVNLGI